MSSPQPTEVVFYATAGRGTEIFVSNEIKDKICSSHVKVRDGKVFFNVGHYSNEMIEQILALKSVERAFIAITDYNNLNYIQGKRTFLDKLMSELASKENYEHATIVMAQLFAVQACRVAAPGNLTTTKSNKELTENHQDYSFNTDFSTHNLNTTEGDEKEDGIREPSEKKIKLDIIEGTTTTCQSNVFQNSLDGKDVSGHSKLSSSEESNIKKSSRLPCSKHHNLDKKSTDQATNGFTPQAEQPLSFRVSVKCSGKVGRWLNLKRISKDIGWRVSRATGWRVELRQPQVEVCVHISDDHVTAGVPLSRLPLSKRNYTLDSGLRAPIAWIMCQLAAVKEGDVVLDPMCGKATILMEALSELKMVTCIGCDIDEQQILSAGLNRGKAGMSGTMSLLKADGLYMPWRNDSVDVVVCDVPFNQNHVIPGSPQGFYSKFLKNIYRVLRPQGRCVLLTSQELKPMLLSFVHVLEPSVADGTDETNGTTSASLEPQNIPQLSSGGSDSCTLTKCKESGDDNINKEKMVDLKETTSKSDLSLNSVMIRMTLVSEHYVKLGETHAFIVVLRKM